MKNKHEIDDFAEYNPVVGWPYTPKKKPDLVEVWITAALLAVPVAVLVAVVLTLPHIPSV